MVDRQALLVALADFGEDVNPVLGLHAVICLDVQDSSFRLDHLEHLQTQVNHRMNHPIELANLGPGSDQQFTEVKTKCRMPQ